MKPLKDPSKLSDRELSAMLKSMREDVAAPAGFRGQVLARLAEEGILPQAPAPTLLQRLSAAFTLPRLGLAASAACALALVLLNTQTPPTVGEPALSEGAAPNAVPARAEGPKIYKVSKAKQSAPAEIQQETEAVVAQAPVAADAVEAESADLAKAEAPALAAGSAPAPAASQALGLAASSASAPQAPQFASGGVAGASAPVQAAEVNKPIIIVVNPTPTPMAKALKGDSEVRNNVVRASRGEQALVIFRVGQAGPVRVDIHDRLGRPVAVLKDASLGAGTYELRWAGAADEGGLAASGIYELRIQAPGYEARHKLMLVK